MRTIISFLLALLFPLAFLQGCQSAPLANSAQILSPQVNNLNQQTNTTQNQSGIVSSSKSSADINVDVADKPWAVTLLKQISEQEYYISETSKGLQASNRSQNFRTYFSKHGIRVEPRSGEERKTLLAMQFAGISRHNIMANDDPDSLANTPRLAKSIVFDKNQVQLEHGAGIQEWYINSDNGLEHGFNIAERPEGEGHIKIVLNVTQAEIIEDGADIKIKLHNGSQLDYKKLIITDAKQQIVPASLVKVSSNQLQIQFDDSQYQFPMIVDPILTSTVDIAIESNQADASLGFSVASAGDVNGDGYTDVIVGVPNYDNGEANEGAAFIYQGSASGVSAAGSIIIESEQVNANFGTSVASAGDVNGDGYADVIVGAPSYDNGETNEGVAFIYHGSASGVSSPASTTLEGNQINASFGISVASAGYVNDDNYADVIVGANLYDNGEFREGVAFIYHGSASGVSSPASTILESNQINAWLGQSVASAGDVNNDGYDDVIVGAPYYDNGETSEGAAFIYHGSQTGVIATASATIEGNQAYASLGISVASAGYVNDDNYADVIVGAHLYDNGQSNEGAAFIYHGSQTGLLATASTTLESNQIDAWFGKSVASAGDVNGDGYTDVIVGAHLYDNVQTDEGATFIYHGSASGVSSTANTTLERNQDNAWFGFSVASAGDVNNDGYADVIIGAPSYTNGESNEGTAFIYHGGVPIVPSILIADSNLFYTENDTATQIDGAAILSHPQGDTDWNGGSLVIQITTSNEAADEISIPDNVVDTINTSGTNILNGTTTIGTLSASEGTVANGTALTVFFNSNASNLLVQQVLRSIHFRNISDNPGRIDRIITFTAIDKNDNSDSDNRIIEVTPTNDAPTISGIPDSVVIAGQEYNFIPVGNDVDADNLTYTISGIPGWALFSTSSGALTDTPHNIHSGIYNNIQISVTDGEFSASLPVFSIEVLADTDFDGMPNDWENANGLDPLVSDAALDGDGDGLSNLEEYTADTNPTLADTDGDGMNDGYEIANGLDPNDSSDCPSWMCGSSKIWMYKLQLSNP